MGKRQGSRRKAFHTAAALCAALALAACTQMPGISPHGGKFQPVERESAPIAAAAAPRDAQEAVEQPIVCRLSKGSARFDKKWVNFRTTEFTVSSTQRMPVTLAAVRGNTQASLQAWHDAGNQRLIFCPVVDGPPDKKISCASLYALDDDLSAGIKRTFDIKGAIQGGVITCAHSAAHLQD